MVLLLLVGPQCVPPLPEDLADCPVVLVRVSLVHQGPVAFAEDHEGVHGAADVVLLPLVREKKKKKKKTMESESRYLSSPALEVQVSTFLFRCVTACWAARCTDLPVSVLGQGTEGLCASLDGDSRWRCVVGHARRETVVTQRREKEKK